MLKLVVVAVLVALVCCQLIRPDFNEWLQAIDHFHDLTVQYDDRHDVFIFFNDQACYLVPAQTERWDDVVRNLEALHRFTDRIYAQIHNNEGVTRMTQQEAVNRFHSSVEQFECRSKDVYLVTLRTLTATA